MRNREVRTLASIRGAYENDFGKGAYLSAQFSVFIGQKRPYILLFKAGDVLGEELTRRLPMDTFIGVMIDKAAFFLHAP